GGGSHTGGVAGGIIAHIPNGAFTIRHIQVGADLLRVTGTRRPFAEEDVAVAAAHARHFGDYQAAELGCGGDCRVGYLAHTVHF
ncbi:hypothetical protein PSZ86_22870, partial [Shigella sonnei]|nr:hypothetical protein [Shigella sonnei]